MATWELCSLEVRASPCMVRARPWSCSAACPTRPTLPCRLDSNASAMRDRSALRCVSASAWRAGALRFQRAKLPGVVAEHRDRAQQPRDFVAAGAAVGHGDLQIAGSQRVDHRDRLAHRPADAAGQQQRRSRAQHDDPREHAEWSAW